ncbi:MAG: tail fiber protein [Anaerolineae bacterium]
MSSPFVAEIRMFGCNFAPTGWAQCNGQLLPISQNTALFSLLGTTYGGDGKSTFGLPNLQGCIPMQQGQGAGLSLRDLGETAGEDSVTLLQTEMSSHAHGAQGFANAGGQNPGSTTTWSDPNQRGLTAYTASSAQNVTMNPLALSVTGGSLPHNNLMPYLVVNFCIAMQGIYPARS